MCFISKYSYYAGSIWTLLRGIRHPWNLIPLFMRSRLNQPQLLELPQQGLLMWVRGRMDAWSVKEAMLDRFYERYGTHIQANWTIVDVGAAIGEFTVLAAIEAPQGRVIAIEPNPGSIKLLKQNLEVNKINNVEIVQKGLWRESSLQTLELLNNEPLQAVTQSNGHVHPDQIRFETQTLANLLSQHQLQHINLLKSDAEGAEYDFLLTSPACVLSLIERIVLEYHEVDEDRNHRVLSEFLTANGYKVRLTPSQVHSNIGYLYAERKGL